MRHNFKCSGLKVHLKVFKLVKDIYVLVIYFRYFKYYIANEYLNIILQGNSQIDFIKVNDFQMCSSCNKWNVVYLTLYILRFFQNRVNTWEVAQYSYNIAWLSNMLNVSCMVVVCKIKTILEGKMIHHYILEENIYMISYNPFTFQKFS